MRAVATDSNPSRRDRVVIVFVTGAARPVVGRVRLAGFLVVNVACPAVDD